MRSTVYVVEPSTFQAWLRSQPANAAPPVGTPPAQAALAGEPGAPSSAPSGGTSEGAGSSKSGPGATSSTSSTAAGKAVFTGTAGCSQCHTLAAAGAIGTIGPNLDVRLRTDCASAASKRVRGATLKQCIHTAIISPYKYIPSGYQSGIMPSNFAQSLTSTQIQELVKFLATVAK
jgi:cytochrome c2